MIPTDPNSLKFKKVKMKNSATSSAKAGEYGIEVVDGSVYKIVNGTPSLIEDGVDGANAFVYIAYASADDGTDFTTTFNASLDYIAILPTDTEIAAPAVGDFAGLWFNYKGDTGAAGADGADAFVYIAYASADDGTDFTLTFSAALAYIAILATDTEIETPQASDFAGLWIKYKGTDGADGNDGADGADGVPVADAAGTVDAITADFTQDITLSDKKIVAIVAAGANATTTPTFAPDGLTAHTIVKKGGNALVAGDIPGAGAVCLLEYNLANTRWELLNPAAGSSVDVRDIGAVFDGGGAPILADKKCYVRVERTCTITGAFAFADVSGSIAIAVWKDTFANFPPTVADVISASAPITLSTAQTVMDTTLTGWTLSLTAGDIICFNVNALATSCTWVACGLITQ